VGVALRAWLWSVLTEPFHCFSVLEIAVDTGLMCRWLLCYRNWRRIKWHCSEGATFWNAPCRTSAHNTKLWKHNLTRTKLTCRLELSCFVTSASSAADCCDEHVCESGCLSVSISLEPHVQASPYFHCLLPVTSVFLWWRSNTVCISRFVDDVIFS